MDVGVVPAGLSPRRLAAVVDRRALCLRSRVLPAGHHLHCTSQGSIASCQAQQSYNTSTHTQTQSSL